MTTRRGRPPLEGLLTVREAAQIKGCSTKAVYDAILAGRLPATQMRTTWVLLRRDVEQWTLIGHRPKKGR